MTDFKPKGAFPLWMSDFEKDTRGWTGEERWQYLRLLNDMWWNGGYIEDDLDVIAEAMGLNRARNWREKAEKVRLKLFSRAEKPGFVTQGKLLREVARAAEISQKRAKAGKKGAEKKQANAKANAIAPYPTLPLREEREPPKVAAKVDIKDRIFGGLSDWLIEKTGKDKQRVNAILGKWIKEFGEPELIEAALKAHRENPVEPVSWIAATLRKRQGGGTRSKYPSPPRQLVDDARAFLVGIPNRNGELVTIQAYREIENEFAEWIAEFKSSLQQAKAAASEGRS